jgi:iron complex transport system substrate-binding protein
MKRRFVLFLLTVVVIATFGLSGVGAQVAANLTDGCVQTYDASRDYFPEKVVVKAAEGFTVEYFKNYKLVTVKTPWQGAEKPLQYVLVQCGTPAPQNYTDALIVNVPVKTMVSMSTSFLPHIVGQGVLDRVVAIDTALYTSIPEVVEKVKAGKVVEIGGGGAAEVNIEKLIELKPDLVMTQRFSAADKSYPAMQQAGLSAVINADFLDTSPLGQAEWGKFIAVFFNTEAAAEKAFDGVQTRYEKLTRLAAAVPNRPTVFVNTAYQGTWFMPGGKSYAARLLADAGADYLWKDDTATGSLTLSFEAVFDKAANAAYWVNVFAFWASLDDAQKEDERYAKFAAFQSGQVYTNTARTNGNGSSDYYESGVANPDVILADLIRIFHPDLLPDHELVYYKQVAKGQ